MSEEKDFSQEQPTSATVSQAAAVSWAVYEPYFKAFVEGRARATDSEMVRKLMGVGSFSWMSLLVGPSYWAYRRCYKEAALFALCWLALALVNILLGIDLSVLVLYIPAGFLFYPLYRKYAMRAYREAYAAHGGDHETMLDAMRAAGGVSWGAFFILFAFEMIVIVALFCVTVGPLLMSRSL